MVKPWKALKRSIHIHSPFKQIEDVLFELPDGRQATFSLSYIGKVVAVLALTKDRQVVLARQFRPGPNRVLDELPGGHVDDGEEPESAVARELLEETGYVPGKLIPLGRFFEGAYSTIDRYGFLALDCEPGSGQSLDHNEFIEVVLKPLPEFFTQLRKGEATDCEVGWAALLEAGYLSVRDCLKLSKT